MDTADLQQIKEIVVDPLADKVDTILERQDKRFDGLHASIEKVNGAVRQNTVDVAIIQQRCADRERFCAAHACLPIRVARWAWGLLNGGRG